MILEVRIPKELRADFWKCGFQRVYGLRGVCASWRANDGPEAFELTILITLTNITY